MKRVLFTLLIAIIVSCDGGLKPEPESRSYLTGNVIFTNSIEDWVPADSLYDLRVVAFKNFPPENVILEVLGGQAYFTQDSLEYYVENVSFKLEIPDAPVELKYIAVAQQYDSVLTAWRAVGVYNTSGDNAEHSSIFIEKGETKEISITVDFTNLPPQPFKLD